MGDVLGGGLGGGASRPPLNNQHSKEKRDGWSPDISDILNNMSSNQNVNVDLNSGFSESEVETATGTRKHRSLDLDI